MSLDGLKFADLREAVGMTRDLPNESKLLGKQAKSSEIRVQPTCTIEVSMGNGVDILRAPSSKEKAAREWN